MAYARKGNCRHCKHRKAWTKGLCHRCWKNTEIRNRYKALNAAKKPRVGLRDRTKDEIYWLPPPDEPTEALPGSEEKIEVMRKREAAGKQVFHPDDG